MKCLQVFAVALFIPATIHAQSIPINGVITVRNSAYRTGKTVHVRDAAVRAAQAKPVSSDVDGHFALEVVGLEAGTTMKLSVEHDKWVVLDPRAVEHVVLGASEPLVIRMADPRELAEERIKYHGIAEASIEARYKERMQRLRDSTVALQDRLNEVVEQFGGDSLDLAAAVEVVLKQRQVALEETDGVLERFILADLDAASDRFRQAFEAFTSGKIDEALDLLDERELDRQRTDAFKQRMLGEEKITGANNAIREVHRCYGLKADVLQASMRPREAYRNRRAELSIVEENQDLFGAQVFVRSLWSVADLETELGFLDTAQAHLGKALHMPWTNAPEGREDRMNALRVLGTCKNNLSQEDSVLLLQHEILRTARGMQPPPWKAMSLAHSACADALTARLEPAIALLHLDTARAYAMKDSSAADLLMPGILSDMGRAKGGLYQLTEAIGLVEQAMELENARPVPNLLRVAGHLSAMWRLQDLDGQFEASMNSSRRIRDTYIQVYGSDHPAVYMEEGTLAYSMMTAGRKDSALVPMDRCINGLVEWFGKDAPDLAERYNARAAILGELRRYKEAIEDYRRSNDFIVGNAKDDRLGRAFNLTSIGSFFYSLHELDSSLFYLQQGLDSLAAVHGTAEHPDAMAMHAIIGRTLTDLQEFDKGLVHFRIALGLNEAVFGPEHANLLRLLTEMAKSYRITGQMDSCRHVVDRCAKIARLPDAGLPERVNALIQCSIYQEWAGNPIAALAYADSSLAIALLTKSESHGSVRAARVTIARMLVLNDRHDEAIPHLNILISSSGERVDQNVLYARSLRGGAYLLSGNTDSARVCIEESVRLSGGADALWYEYLLKRDGWTADERMDALLRCWNMRRKELSSSPQQEQTTWEAVSRAAIEVGREGELKNVQPRSIDR